jgi:hypothetical protein
MWPDLADNPRKLWFARFNPDTGLSAPQNLTSTAGAETGVSALVDTSGTLNLVWQVAGTGGSEIHYQRRFKSRRPAPRDTTLVASAATSVANPHIGIDPSGTLHVAYETTIGSGPEIYYKRWRPAWGWDFGGTEITSTADGTASTALVLPETPGNLSIVYTGYGAQGARFMERRRQLDGPPAPALPLAAVVPTGAAALRPNPLRAGQEFELVWTGSAPALGATAEIYDLAGRRVMATLLERRGTTWRARFSGAVTARLTSGVYFVRARAAGAPAQRLVVLR